MKKYSNITIFCILFAIVAAWFLLFRFNTLQSSFERDEGEYAYGAQVLHDGGAPYKEDFMQKPPMVIYTYYVSEFFSSKTIAPRILALLFLIFSTLLTMDILRKEYSRRVALIFLILFPPLVSVPFFAGMSAQPEVFLILPLALSLWCYFAYFRKKNIWLLLGIGAFSAMAFLFKPIVLPGICFIMLSAVMRLKTEKFILMKEHIKRFILVSLGFIATTCLVILPIWMRGGLPYMWDSAFKYNYYYSSVVGLSAYSLKLVLFLLWPMLLLSVWCFFKDIKYKYFFGGLLVALFIGTDAGVMMHYYIIVLPALSIMAAIGIDSVADHLPSIAIKRRNLYAYAFALLLVFYFWFPYADRFAMTPDEVTLDQFGMYPFRESVLMAGELQKVTSPSDTVFIEGNEPEILYYAHRRSATRFVITYPLTLNTSLKDTYVQEVISTLASNHPKAIITDDMPPFKVFARGPQFLSPMEAYVTGLLVNEYTFVGAVVTDDKTGKFFFDSSFNDLNDKDVKLALFVRNNDPQ